jgi:hypothetical protein
MFIFTASYPMGTGALSPGVKRPGSEADRSPPTSAEVMTMWIYLSTEASLHFYFYLIRSLKLSQRVSPRLLSCPQKGTCAVHLSCCPTPGAGSSPPCVDMRGH